MIEKAGSEGALGPISLDCLPVGQVGTIHSVEEGGVSSARLGMLGFLPGRVLRLARAAPLGDPIAVDINGTRIGLRRCDARAVLLSARK